MSYRVNEPSHGFFRKDLSWISLDMIILIFEIEERGGTYYSKTNPSNSLIRMRTSTDTWFSSDFALEKLIAGVILLIAPNDMKYNSHIFFRGIKSRSGMCPRNQVQDGLPYVPMFLGWQSRYVFCCQQK